MPIRLKHQTAALIKKPVYVYNAPANGGKSRIGAKRGLMIKKQKQEQR
jgi:hypothetical protein